MHGLARHVACVVRVIRGVVTSCLIQKYTFGILLDIVYTYYDLLKYFGSQKGGWSLL